MYRIYIRNYTDAPSPSTERLLDASDLDTNNGNRTIVDPVVKNELNKTGSLEFTILPENPYYNKLKIVKTILSVELDGVFIFRGRIMTLTDDIYRQRKVFCEGELGYLNDSLQPPITENTPDVADYLNSLIQNHNRQMDTMRGLVENYPQGEDDKHFSYYEFLDGETDYSVNATNTNTYYTASDGTVILDGEEQEGDQKVTYQIATQPIKSTSYRKTLDAIQSNLLDIYGGYLSVVYEGGVRKLYYGTKPWNSIGVSSEKMIAFGVNLQELTLEQNASEVYSALLPTGDNNLLAKSGSSNISSDTGLYSIPKDAILTYGPILKTQSFSGIRDRTELRNYSKNYISKTYKGADRSYTIKAIDMHFVDSAIPLILVGNSCRITLWPGEAAESRVTVRTCTAATYELQAPENNEYVFEDIAAKSKNLTSRYRKSSGGGGGSSAVTTGAGIEGATSQDTVIKSEGNIILMPGDGKFVSIPLSAEFTAPSLTKIQLGQHISYQASSKTDPGVWNFGNVQIAGGVYHSLTVADSTRTGGVTTPGTITTTDLFASNIYASQYLVTERTATGAQQSLSMTNKSISLMGSPTSQYAPVLIGVRVLGNTGSANSDYLDLRHYHKITITEVTTGENAGKMQVTIGEAVGGLAVSNTDFFKIAATQTYLNGIAAIDILTLNAKSTSQTLAGITRQTGNVTSYQLDLYGDLGFQEYSEEDGEYYPTTTRSFEKTLGIDRLVQDIYASAQTNANAVIDAITYSPQDTMYAANLLNVDVFAAPALQLTSLSGQQTSTVKTGMTETIQIPVAVTNSTLRLGDITYDQVDSQSVTYAGQYTITGSGGKASIDGADIPVGVTSLALSLVLNAPVVAPFTYNRSTSKYTYTPSVSATVNGTQVLTRTFPEPLELNAIAAIRHGTSLVGLKAAVWQNATHSDTAHRNMYKLSTNGRVDANGAADEAVDYLDPTDAIYFGKQSVTVTSLSRVESCAFEVNYGAKPTGTAKQDVLVILEDGREVLIKDVNFDDVYQTGLDNIQGTLVTSDNIGGYVPPFTEIDSTKRIANLEFEAELSDSGDYTDYQDELILTVEDIYERGLNDAYRPFVMMGRSGNYPVNLQKTMSTSSSETIGRLKDETWALLLEPTNTYTDWVHVQYGSQKGYIKKQHTWYGGDARVRYFPYYPGGGGWYEYNPDSPTGDDEFRYYGTIYASSGSTVNIREYPRTGSSKLSRVSVGSRVMCYEDPVDYEGCVFRYTTVNEIWMPVKSGGVVGYIQAQYIVGTKKHQEVFGNVNHHNGDATANDDYPYYGVTTRSSRIYETPNGTVLETVPIGTEIMCLVDPSEQSVGWTPCYYQSPSDGEWHTGYIQLVSFQPLDSYANGDATGNSSYGYYGVTVKPASVYMGPTSQNVQDTLPVGTAVMCYDNPAIKTTGRGSCYYQSPEDGAWKTGSIDFSVFHGQDPTAYSRRPTEILIDPLAPVTSINIRLALADGSSIELAATPRSSYQDLKNTYASNPDTRDGVKAVAVTSATYAYSASPSNSSITILIVYGDLLYAVERRAYRNRQVNGESTGNSSYPYYGVTTQTAYIYPSPTSPNAQDTLPAGTPVMCYNNPATTMSGNGSCRYQSPSTNSWRTGIINFAFFH